MDRESLHPAGRRPVRRRARRGSPSRATRRSASRSWPASPRPRDSREHRVDAWQLADIPDQAGRTIVVTGTSLGGLGHHTALELARRGGRVVLAGRTQAKLDETAETIRSEVPAAALEQLVVDLSDLASVRRAAARARRTARSTCWSTTPASWAPRAPVTDDGLDLQLATNHFGPFLLTGLLLPQLVASGAATVVTVSSNMHRMARGAPLGDPHGAPRPLLASGASTAQTKLANLLFTYELDRRAREAGAPGQGARRPPGLRRHPPGRQRPVRPLRRRHRLDPRRHASRRVSQSGRARRLADADGRHRRPAGRDVRRPRRARRAGGRTRRSSTSTGLSRDEDAQRRLWELSEETTGIRYP